MQRLSVDGRDGGEGELEVVGDGHLSDSGGNIAFPDARSHRVHGRQVHVRRHEAGLLDLGDLLIALIDTLVDDAHDEGNRRLLAAGQDTQPLEQLDLVLGPVGWQIVDCLPFGLGILQVALDLVVGANLTDADPLALLMQCGLDTSPDDHVNRQLVAKDDLLVVIDIDDGRQPRVGQAEKVQESGVLAEMVTVVRVIHAALVIAQEKQEA